MLVSVQGLCKRYNLGGETIEVASHLDLSVQTGDFLAIMGTSGSGKSTLLHILGGLSRPDAGRYSLHGRDMLALDDRERSWVRANWIGFVFQTFNLLDEYDVWQNVSLPFLYRDIRDKEKKLLVEQAITNVSMIHRIRHRPSELSGGEMQRVAIARALAINPLLILADEPTGNLDEKNSQDILQLFLQLNASGTTIIMVTHDRSVASYAKRILYMKNGMLQVS